MLNEGELTLPLFLADLARGCPQPVYTSTDYADIQQTPVPAWELLDFKRYATINIQFSRGCPFNCDFCNVTALLGHRPRTKTAAQIIAELDGIYRLGWRSNVFFVDDNLIGNKRSSQNRTAAGADRVAARQSRHHLLHRSLDQSGRRRSA